MRRSKGRRCGSRGNSFPPWMAVTCSRSALSINGCRNSALNTAATGPGCSRARRAVASRSPFRKRLLSSIATHPDHRHASGGKGVPERSTTPGPIRARGVHEGPPRSIGLMALGMFRLSSRGTRVPAVATGLGSSLAGYPKQRCASQWLAGWGGLLGQDELTGFDHAEDISFSLMHKIISRAPCIKSAILIRCRYRCGRCEMGSLSADRISVFLMSSAALRRIAPVAADQPRNSAHAMAWGVCSGKVLPPDGLQSRRSSWASSGRRRMLS
jgi:hypothetical protein